MNPDLALFCVVALILGLFALGAGIHITHLVLERVTHERSYQRAHEQTLAKVADWHIAQQEEKSRQLARTAQDQHAAFAASVGTLP